MSDKQNSGGDAPQAKLGFFAMIAVVVGSMLGGGVYSLPQNMAQSSAIGPVIVSWIIAGVGVYFIANTFRILADARPDLQAGIYMYAREGFGPFIGFISAWGYWLMAAFGNVAFAVILMDSFNYFFPGVFTGGNNLNSIIVGSILIWAYNFLVLSGVRVSGIVNTVGTVAKIVPLVLFILIVGFMLSPGLMFSNFWGHSSPEKALELGSITSQVMAPMIVALWAFIGVEGAVVLSGRAKNKADVGKATLIGFIVALVVYVLLSVLPFGIAPQHVLTKIANPSTAGVLQMVVGHWGAWLMNVGLIVSIMAGWLAWTMLCAEIPMAAGVNGTFPKAFARTNKNDAPSVSLWVSSCVMQTAMLLVYFSPNAWNTMLSISTVMVLPSYLASTLFLVKMARNGEFVKYAGSDRILGQALASGVIGTIFGLFILYAGGLQYVAMIPLFLTVGVPVYMWSRREHDASAAVFAGRDKLYLVVLLALDALVLALWAAGVIKL
ncbi:basic amino acid/polyamine antiporter [Crenobacter intestini]|uniref:Amino acid permease n=1 Tax=Crenobacter intestini TaxID=2563443 RepID=A0A4T0UP15_9NEIS|nr:basic amino acid/polyamine antiporter [Crenobacter intestini]TIC80510.1 amino acid permease [Crenobacter intestini]